jgi:hypothetical protein
MNLNNFLSWALHDAQAQDVLGRLTDTRKRPQIPTAHCAWLVLLGGVLRVGSLLQMEALGRRAVVRTLLGVTDSACGILVASDSIPLAESSPSSILHPCGDGSLIIVSTHATTVSVASRLMAHITLLWLLTAAALANTTQLLPCVWAQHRPLLISNRCTKAKNFPPAN